MYDNGRGVPQDYAKALKWYRLAAEQGHAFAPYNLGVMYERGEGVPQDYGKAVKWYRKAAEQGDASAQNNLGIMYRNGKGVPQDNVLAHMWWSLATAAQGNNITPAIVVHKAAKNRDKVATLMTPAAIEEAQRFAHECLARKYQNCGR